MNRHHSRRRKISSLLEQLEEIDVLDPLGKENVFLAQPRFGAALGEAVAAAERWIAGEDEQAICWAVAVADWG